MMRTSIFTRWIPRFSKNRDSRPSSSLKVENLETLVMPAVFKWAPPPLPAPVAVVGTTGTGLDQLVKIIVNDTGLRRRVSAADITEGAKAANQMNQWIVDAIRETGIANDGELNAADLRDANAYLRARHASAWRTLHGRDAWKIETGFHKVRGDGALSRLYSRNAVDAVAEGVYQMGFEINGTFFRNEKGHPGKNLESVSNWLNGLLAKDLAGTSLRNDQIDTSIKPSTGTGLDTLVEIIAEDKGLNRKLATSAITAGARAADAMNVLIVSAIKATGVANDNALSNDDVRTVSAYLTANSAVLWTELHGNDKTKGGSGFHKVKDKGASTFLLGRNAVNAVAEGIFQIGFGISKNRFLNESGKLGTTVSQVGSWLRSLLAADLANGSLKNEQTVEPVQGTSQTSLDQIVNQIANDTGLQGSLSQTQINVGAKAADDMNVFLIDAIRNTFVAADGSFSEEDVVAISNYLVQNRGSVWAGLFNDFASVRDQGATSTLFNENVVQNIGTTVYLIGFQANGNAFAQGNLAANASAIANWLNQLLSRELAEGYFVPNS